MFKGVQKDIASMTLGYALMSVLDNSDNGWGPTLLCRTINQWDIDLKFMEKSLKLNIRPGVYRTLSQKTPSS
ncbi:hypothetical protein JVT61DRAFT_13325 [Boletus reticuloceps]|uniref:Uncharacterized protein n=1 Tax=Boletus reticuloceps TaxID=495285 RepID=A0A8I2YDP1_9AGAM|nr:hypothetical protein JVT61DRAFT_13325 [Boletus reticuloceps]